MRTKFSSVSLAIIAVFMVATEAVSQTKPSVQNTAVAFKNVAFSYDKTVFGEVQSETVAAQSLDEPGDKPDGVAPQYIRFAFALGREDSDAHISVYPVTDFAKAFAVNKNLEKTMQQKVKGLKQVIQDPAYRHQGEIPHLPFRDATDNFYTRVKQVTFQGGKGVVFVTHWTHGVALISNKNLVYRFEGFTDDGKYYITAETPVSVRFLPFDPPDKFEGFTYEHLYEAYRRPEMKRRYEDYLKSITDRLRKLEPVDFYPNLNHFEAMIGSLKVGR